MDLRWQPRTPLVPTTTCLRWDSLWLAMVCARVDGRGWLSTVGTHLRDFRRHLAVFAPSEASGQRWAERWVRSSWPRIERELPVWAIGADGRRGWVYPMCYPSVFDSYRRKGGVVSVPADVRLG